MSRHRIGVLPIFAVATLFTGCGVAEQRSASPPSTEALSQAVATPVKHDAKASGEATIVPDAAITTATGLNRKIIYTAQVDMVVENLDDVRAT